MVEKKELAKVATKKTTTKKVSVKKVAVKVDLSSENVGFRQVMCIMHLLQKIKDLLFLK